MRKIPQANDLNKVIKLVELVGEGNTHYIKLADLMGFDKRQSSYYGEAAEMLGLLNPGNGVYSLTETGKSFLKSESMTRDVLLMTKILDIAVFKEIFQKLSTEKSINSEKIIYIIYKLSGLNETTSKRRSSTIISWLKWAGSELDLFEFKGNEILLNNEKSDFLDQLL